MNITIHENLREYRKKKGNTQEALAGHLGISVQAVSKWERGEGFPDITLLPHIALYYDVSVDDLLGVGKIQIEQKAEEYYQKSDVLQREGDFDGNLALWREAAGLLPNHHVVLYGLMAALFLKNQAADDPNAYAEEMIQVAERLWQEGTLPRHRHEVIHLMCRLYNRLGEPEKALEYVRHAPLIHATQDYLLAQILKGEEAVTHIQESLSTFTDYMYKQVNIYVQQGDFSNAEQRKAHQYNLKIFQALFEDGDYGFYCTHVATVYRNLARCDALDKNTDSTLQMLTRAAEYAIRFLTQKGFRHTSFLQNRLSLEDGFHGYPTSDDGENECDELLQLMQQSEFDFCREEAAFRAIEKDLAKHANALV